MLPRAIPAIAGEGRRLTLRVRLPSEYPAEAPTVELVSEALSNAAGPARRAAVAERLRRITDESVKSAGACVFQIVQDVLEWIGEGGPADDG